MPATAPRRVLLDTDPGIDDALAILLALASPEITLTALTVVHGNCPLSEAVANALALLELGGATQIPVAVGCAAPLLRPPFTATETHGLSGLGYARLPAATIAPVAEHGVDLLIRELLAAPGQISLVAVGPLTNLALALRKEPQIVAAIGELIIMGAAFQADGNTTPLAEFNIYADPHAAKIVFDAGLAPTIVPWDITREIRLGRHDIDRLLQRGGPIAEFIAEATRFYIEFHLKQFGYAGCAINDPAALALVYWPHLARTTQAYIDVEISSELTMGKTIADFQGLTGKHPNAQIVTHFDGEGFVAHFVERMEQLIDRLA
ncbi:MAG: nucleoside hydrolase [Oscillochloris sp.]|nr:nucleoside hydrolase [Oscillochloris sp.]